MRAQGIQNNIDKTVQKPTESTDTCQFAHKVWAREIILTNCGILWLAHNTMSHFCKNCCKENILYAI